LIISSGLALFVYLYPKEKLLIIIVNNAEEALNRKISIKNINYSLRGVVLKKVILYEEKTADSGIFSSADEVILRFSIFSLLQLKLNLNKITLKNFDFNIVFNKNGISNIGNLIKELSSQKGSSAIETKISNIELDNANIKLKNPPPLLKPLEGSYKLSTAIRIYDNKIIGIDDCKIQLPQKRGVVYPVLKINAGAEDLLLSGNVKLSNVSLLWVYRWGKNINVPYHIVNGEVKDLKITKNSIKGHVIAASTLKNSKKIVHVNGFCNVNRMKKTVFLSNIRGKINNSSFIINKLMFTFKGKLGQFKVTDIDSQFSDIQPILNFIPAKLFGHAIGNLALNNGKYNGKIKLIDSGFDSVEKTISNLNTEITIKNNSLKKSNIPLNIFGYPSSISIATLDNSFSKLFINLTSSKIKILKTEDKKQKKKLTIKPPIDIIFKINIKELEYESYKLLNFLFNSSISKNKIDIKGFSGNIYGGQIFGRGVINITKFPHMASLSLKFNKIKVQDIVSKSKIFANRFFGIANGELKLKFKLDNNIFNSITGKIIFNIDKGKLAGTGVQRALGIWLSELKYKLNDLEFNKIYGNFDIKGDKYKINSFIFNAPDIRLNVKGSFNKNIIADPILFALEFNNHFIQDMPRPAIKLLRIDKYYIGGWYIIPFSIKGDITNTDNIKRLR